MFSGFQVFSEKNMTKRATIIVLGFLFPVSSVPEFKSEGGEQTFPVAK
jgi:hypothetical protein